MLVLLRSAFLPLILRVILVRPKISQDQQAGTTHMPKHDILEIADFLSVVVKGKLDVPYFQQITDVILKTCKEKNIRKVVVDVSDTKVPYSDAEKLEFATYVSATLKEVVDKYAYVYPREIITYTPQVISQGSGFNVRGFTSLDDALAWIEGK